METRKRLQKRRTNSYMAYKTELVHPITGETQVFIAPPPREWGRYAPHTLP